MKCFCFFVLILFIVNCGGFKIKPEGNEVKGLPNVQEFEKINFKYLEKQTIFEQRNESEECSKMDFLLNKILNNFYSKPQKIPFYSYDRIKKHINYMPDSIIINDINEEYIREGDNPLQIMGFSIINEDSLVYILPKILPKTKYDDYPTSENISHTNFIILATIKNNHPHGFIFLSYQNFLLYESHQRFFEFTDLGIKITDYEYGETNEVKRVKSFFVNEDKRFIERIR